MVGIVCWNVETPEAKGWHFSIRHRVFVEEQRVIPMTDIDDWDRRADTIHVLACRDRQAAGTVRIYRTGDGGMWRGDRLAVLPDHRATLLGVHLVHHAVSTASALGGDVMDALVQVQNVVFFERLGWSRVAEPVPYFGLPHQRMTFRLADAQALDVTAVPTDVRLSLPAHRDEPSPLLVPAIAAG